MADRALKDRMVPTIPIGQLPESSTGPGALRRGGQSSLFDVMFGRAKPGEASMNDSLIDILEALGNAEGGGGMQGMMRTLLGNLRGQQDHLRELMQTAAPFMAAMQYQTPSYKALQDVDKLDNTMQQYGPMAGQIAAAGTAGVNQAQNQLARSGLGRSAMGPALAAQSQLGVASQQADLFSRLNQQAMQNRVNNLRYANQMDQDIARLILGVQAAPRVGGDASPKQSDAEKYLMPGAAIMGQAAGNFLAGPISPFFRK